MCPEDLRAFLQLLEQADQLVRVSVAVDPQLELSTIVDRSSRTAGGGQALLFEEVIGSQLPVAANLFGTPERIGWSLGTTDLTGLAERLANDVRATGEADPGMALRTLTRRAIWQPVIDGRSQWREVDHGAAGLDLLPPVKAWPGDGGPYLTLPQVYTRHPEGGALNCGMYRVQIHNRSTATIRYRQGSGAARHMGAWHERGREMPVAIALGGPPALTWAAGAPLPEGVEEAAFCGYLTGRRLVMSDCRDSDLQVPASAEVVIEGVIAPGETRGEGPFGNHTGRYDAEAAAPVLRVRSVRARQRAIYPWTLVGPPPRENLQLARATERLFLPLVKIALPTVQDLHMPDEGIFHRAALVTVDQCEERPLAEIAQLLRGTLLLKGARLLVVGAADHDPHDPSAVFWRVLNRVDWERDLLVENGQVTIDARRLPPGEPVRHDPTVLWRVLARWGAYRIDRA